MGLLVGVFSQLYSAFISMLESTSYNLRSSKADPIQLPIQLQLNNDTEFLSHVCMKSMSIYIHSTGCVVLNVVDVNCNLVDMYFSEYVDILCETCPLTVDTWIRKG